MAEIINEHSHEMWTTFNFTHSNEKNNTEIKGLEILIGVQLNAIEFAVVIIATIASFLANCFTIYILQKFSRLRKFHQNDYIYRISKLNLRNVVLILLLLAMEIYRTSKRITIFSIAVFRGLHLVINVIHSLLFAEYLLMVLMTMDWYIRMAHPSKSATFKKYSKRTIIIADVYVCANILCSFFQYLIKNAFTGFTSYLLLRVILSFSVLFYLCLTVRYCCSYRRQQERNAVGLYISLFKASVWLFLVLILLVDLIDDGFLLNYFIVALCLLFFVIILPAFQLLALVTYDADYRTITIWIFSNENSTASVQRYLEDPVEEVTEIINEILDQTAQPVSGSSISVITDDDEERTGPDHETNNSNASDEDDETSNNENDNMLTSYNTRDDRVKIQTRSPRR